MSNRQAPALGNWIDRAIAAVAPRLAVKRMQARGAMALAGGYQGASFGRPGLAGWAPYASDAQTVLHADLTTLRARTRDLARNSPLATGAISTQVTHVVGTGLSLCASPDREALGLDEEAAEEWQCAVHREFRLWAETTDCDVTRTQNLYGLQSLAFRSALESGDVFALLPNVPQTGRPYALGIQLVEADRVCNPGFLADNDTIAAGIETNAWGAPVAYHICRQHPGSLAVGTSRAWDRVTAFGSSTGRRNVLHLFDRRRPGQIRGVPVLAPVIEPLKQLARYTDAELQAAVISGMFAVFVKMDPEAFHDLFDQDGKSKYLQSSMRWDGTLNGGSLDGAGKAINLLPGEEVESANPGRPNALFDPFVQAIVRQIGVALELPFEVLIKHYTSSYSAARAALLEAWRFFRGRRDWLATVFCQPVYEAWLAEAVARGRVAAPGFFADPAIRFAWCRATWVGDGPGSIDPQKEVAAAKDRIELGISTLAAESILHDGVDWRTKHEQRVVEVAARREDGLEAAPVVQASAPAMPMDPQDPLDPQEPAEPDDPNSDDAPEPADEQAIDEIRSRVAQLEARPIVVPAPSVVVHAHLPETSVTVEAVMPDAPAPRVEVTNVVPAAEPGSVHVNVAPTPVIVQAQAAPATVVVAHPESSRQTVERDADGEIAATVTTYALPGQVEQLLAMADRGG